MSSPNRYPHLLLLCLAFLWAILACSPCGWLSRSGVKLPDRPIEVTEEAARRFHEKLQGAWEDQGQGQFRLQVTEQEVTSYVNLKIQSTVDIPLTHPTIWFSRGRIYVSGELSSTDLPLRGQATIVASAQVADGQLRISVDQASIGRVPIPRAFLDTLEDKVNGGLAQAQLGLQIQRLEIMEGEAIVVASSG